jgi:hypothetical protein
MATNYQITQVTPTTYIDKRNQAISGVLIFVYLPEFDETHEVRAPNMNEATIKPVIEKLLEDRKKLAGLGS